MAVAGGGGGGVRWEGVNGPKSVKGLTFTVFEL